MRFLALALALALALVLPVVAAQAQQQPVDQPRDVTPGAPTQGEQATPQESTNAHPQTEWLFVYLILFAFVLFGAIMGAVYWSENVRRPPVH